MSDIVYLIKHGLPCGTPQFLVAEHPAECPQKGILTGGKLSPFTSRVETATGTAHLHVNAGNPPAVLLSNKGVQVVATIPVNGHRLVFPQDWVIAPGSGKLLATSIFKYSNLFPYP